MVRFLGRLSLPSKHFRTRKAKDIQAFLQQRKAGRLRLPDGYSTDCAQCAIAEELGLLFHNRTGIFMWPQPLCPKGDDVEDAMLLYCYTGEEHFCAAFRSESPWSRLVNELATNLAEGMDFYATARPPDEFESKEAILINMNTDDGEEILSRHRGMADFCIPILVSRQNVKKVSGEIHSISHGPGIDKEGDFIPEDRDLWAVSLTDSLSRDNKGGAEKSIRDLAQDMMDASAEVRHGAVIQIGQRVAASDDPANVELLLGRLDDENADVRRSAVKLLTSLVEKGHDRTLEGIMDIFKDVAPLNDDKSGGPLRVTLHDASPPPPMSVPEVPSELFQVDPDLDLDLATIEEPKRNQDDFEPLSHDCVLLTGKLMALSVLDLILLVFTGTVVTGRIHQSNGGFLAELDDVFLLVTFVLSAVGCISGARVNRELIAHGRTQDDVIWIRKTFYVRCSIELPTLLATVFFFVFLISK